MSSSANENWVLGVTLGLLGSIAINTGNNIQSLGLKSLQNQEKIASEEEIVVQKKRTPSLPSLKFRSPIKQKKEPAKHQLKPWLSPVPTPKTAPSHWVEENDDSGEFVVIKVAKKAPIQSITWLIGTIIFVTGSLLNFASYAFAAQSLLASLESVQFVTNLLFGKFLLGAHVDQTMMAGTCLTVTGTVMAVQFSSKETLELDTEDMKALYINPAYLIYLGVMCFSLVILQVVYIKLKERQDKNKAVKHSEIIMPCVYAVSSALVGTQSVVQAKVLAELLAVQSSGAENIFQSWFTYVTLVAWIITAGIWLKRLNDALKTFNPLFIIPLLQCGFIFFAIVSGGIFFQEFNSFSLNQWCGFWFGIIVMFSGLILLTPKPSTSSSDDKLHEQFVELIEKRSGSMSSIERAPCNPHPSPCPCISLQEDTINDQSATRRTPRLSKENVSNFAKDAVNDIVQTSKHVFSGDPSSRAISEAMMANTQDAGVRRKRRAALEKLLVLIKGEC